jgi:hypothetical protein
VAASHRAADGREATEPTDVFIAMSFCLTHANGPRPGREGSNRKRRAKPKQPGKPLRDQAHYFDFAAWNCATR